MILSMNPMFDIKKKIHFIGIGGIGMSALASILSDKGSKFRGVIHQKIISQRN